MYHFAIVVLLGLAAYKTTDFLLDMSGMKVGSAVKTFVTLGVGVAFTEILDYSLFAGWGIAVRTEWMGPFFTGLIVGGSTYVWHEAIGLVEGYGRRSRDEAIEIERRAPKAA